MPNRALAPSAPKELSELAPRGSKEPGFRRERPAPEDLEADIRGWGHSEHGVSTDFSTGGLSGASKTARPTRPPS